MKLHFTDQTFLFELLRTANCELYGGSEIGEVLATAKQFRYGNFESWHVAWQHTAARVEVLAAHALHERLSIPLRAETAPSAGQCLKSH